MFNLRHFFCGLTGHDALLHFEPQRMSLQCTSCGHQTPGWDMRGNDEPPKPAALAAPQVVRMSLVGDRRVA